MAARKDCYTDEEKAEIAAHVLVNVACGRFVSRIFREDETTESGIKLPNIKTFWKWTIEDETGELDRKLADARERGIEALLDEIPEIADDGRNDTYIIETESGREIEKTDMDVIHRSKLRVEARIKLAQMMKPKKYGPKLDLTSNGLGLSEAMRAAEKRVSED